MQRASPILKFFGGNYVTPVLQLDILCITYQHLSHLFYVLKISQQRLFSLSFELWTTVTNNSFFIQELCLIFLKKSTAADAEAEFSTGTSWLQVYRDE